MPKLRLTWLLLTINIVVFVLMLLNGAGLWHSQNGVQLAWGANFGPATQDGEWWRLGTALFLHFGLIHVALNMWAFWDAGQWVERMYGSFRFALIYFAAGLAGNLLSLVVHAGHAVSGGASGAIFGIYGALLCYLWLGRARIHRDEFRWLFRAATLFSILTIVFGLLIPGIDNAAHIGGLATGALVGLILIRPDDFVHGHYRRERALAVVAVLVMVAGMIVAIPEPAYRWSEEKQIRLEIGEFLQEDAAITRDWEKILLHGSRMQVPADALADAIETAVTSRYDQSFDELSALPSDSHLPSAPTLDYLKQYAEERRDISHSLAEGLREGDGEKVRKAMAQARQAKKER